MIPDRSVGPRGEPEPAQVVLGLLAGDPTAARRAAEAFAKDRRGVDLWMDPVPFHQSGYYEPEMGCGLVRAFCTCGELVGRDKLVQLKASAWDLEQELMHDGRRTVNLDPGLLDHTRLVLASFKPGPYKLYLGGGVWADTLLAFMDGGWRALPWTFADLADEPHLRFFSRCRLRYKQLLKRWRSA
jgi:hypothetical protein